MKKTFLSLFLCLMLSLSMCAQHPIITTKYTADPAPMVYRDTVYLYTTHDEDNADGFLMKDWLLYTSTDMVNWTDHGAVASLKNFSWVNKDNGAWAIQVVERNGKFYMYCPIHCNGIGVLVADTPYGPFKDPLGKPLVWQKDTWSDIDPTVFIDDDGQAYMYWGNPDPYMVRLNEDMVSYSGAIHKYAHPDHYQEGPWFYKRRGHYYLAFASTCCPEGIGYAMSDNPAGPWTTKGYIMAPTEKSRGNHPGLMDYKGKSYVFGLNYDLMHINGIMEHHERRSVSVAEMHYRQDGTIEEVPYWSKAGVAQVEYVNPFRRIESETMAWSRGVKTSKSSNGGIVVSGINDGDDVMVKGVDFGKGGRTFVTEALALAGGTVELHVDSIAGTLIGTCHISEFKNQYHQYQARIKKCTGVHDLYFVFRGTDGKELFTLDDWQIKP
jgi:arabinoxylan arabinofuranohydrolase